jgi:hypothetical protein
MYTIPVLLLLCSCSLFFASRSVVADMRRLQAQLNGPKIQLP